MVTRKWTTEQILEQHLCIVAARKGEPLDPHASAQWKFGYRAYVRTQAPLSTQNRKPTLTSSFSQTGFMRGSTVPMRKSVR
jgi:hypothetical protein